MRYGNPSIATALAELAAAGCRRVVVLPLYPQYAAATAGSTFDAVFAELTRTRWVPGLRTIETYHDEPGYIAALAASVRERWQAEGEPEKLLMSFHGMPQRYFDDGDPYFCYCQKTARLLAEALALPRERCMVSFQSLFGKEEWLKPYTDRTVEALAKQGVRALDVDLPRFLRRLPRDDRGDRSAESRDLPASRRRTLPLPALPQRPRRSSRLSRRPRGAPARAAGSAASAGAGRRRCRHDNRPPGGELRARPAG